MIEHTYIYIEYSSIFAQQTRLQRFVSFQEECKRMLILIRVNMYPQSKTCTLTYASILLQY